ncbi:hypothetical protein SUGI_0303920 [Cryptomeria japonica]|nr:hypothetical protein SUGI_0303920 [Cryptomeria japonica]
MVIQLKEELIMNSYKTIDGRGANVHIENLALQYNMLPISSYMASISTTVSLQEIQICADGLIDTIMGSTAITISNKFFTHRDKVMLLGHSDAYTQDVKMQVAVAFNHFGEGLVQRMPRCRSQHGYFHVVNNDYTHWEMYAIRGSVNPTINSQGNRFLALDN